MYASTVRTVLCIQKISVINYFMSCVIVRSAVSINTPIINQFISRVNFRSINVTVQLQLEYIPFGFFLNGHRVIEQNMNKLI